MSEKNLIDDTFYVEEKKWGTWDSYDKEGKCLITSLTEEECIKMTRFILKLRQEKLLDQVGTTYTQDVSKL